MYRTSAGWAWGRWKPGSAPSSRAERHFARHIALEASCAAAEAAEGGAEGGGSPEGAATGAGSRSRASTTPGAAEETRVGDPRVGSPGIAVAKAFATTALAPAKTPPAMPILDHARSASFAPRAGAISDVLPEPSAADLPVARGARRREGEHRGERGSRRERAPEGRGQSPSGEGNAADMRTVPEGGG